MTGDVETEVIVVGAGPVGLATAIALRRFGVDCVVLERHDSTLDFPRGRGVTVRTMELMRRWGLEEAVVAVGLPRAESLAVFVGENLLASDFQRFALPDQPSTLSPTRPLICDQQAMEVILREAAVEVGADVRFGCEQTDVVGDRLKITSVVVDRASGHRQRLRAPWMVAADGAHSPTRDRLQIGRTGQELSARR
jgi:putative polyketide hydroxylase